jgi:hypothetical protein
MPARELRPELLRKCDVIQVVLAFNYRLTAEDKAKLDVFRRDIEQANSKTLKIIRDKITPIYNSTFRRFGLIGDPMEFIAWFMSYLEEGRSLFVSKADVDANFRNFCDGHPWWKQVPPHLQLQVGLDWVTDPKQVAFHYLLPEAMLYEDMAMAYNLAVEGQHALDRFRNKPGGDPEVKKHHLMLRTAVLSAYYFVEAYLNGIAFDYHFRNKHALAAAQRDLLLEWDSVKNKQMFVSFERKMKEYPKLMLGAQHPPLTIGNCASMSKLLGDAKELRDAIVHQSPKFSESEIGSKKIALMIGIEIDQVTPIVDAAIGFVRQLNADLGPHGINLDWLLDRPVATGAFPQEAFK